MKILHLTFQLSGLELLSSKDLDLCRDFSKIEIVSVQNDSDVKFLSRMTPRSLMNRLTVALGLVSKIPNITLA